MSIDEGVHYEASLDKVRIAYACYHDDYRVKGRTTEQWWGIRDKAKAEFDDWFRKQMADAWDECLELLQNNSEISLGDEELYKLINPYRKGQEDAD